MTKERDREKYLNGGKFLLLEKQLIRFYGIDFHDWANMFEAQKGICPLCRNALLFNHSTHVDHDHATGRVRGLLCHHCNLLLGHIRGDRASTLARALAYLES